MEVVVANHAADRLGTHPRRAKHSRRPCFSSIRNLCALPALDRDGCWNPVRAISGIRKDVYLHDAGRRQIEAAVRVLAKIGTYSEVKKAGMFRPGPRYLPT